VELEAFGQAVLHGRPVPVTGEDGLQALRLALVLVESGQTDRVVEMAEGRSCNRAGAQGSRRLLSRRLSSASVSKPRLAQTARAARPAARRSKSYEATDRTSHI